MRTSRSNKQTNTDRQTVSSFAQISSLLRNSKEFLLEKHMFFTILTSVDSSSRMVKGTSSVFLPVQTLAVSLKDGGWRKRAGGFTDKRRNPLSCWDRP